MTRESTQLRAATLAKPGIAYIARFSVAGEPVDFAVSEDDLRRDARWLGDVLADRGSGGGVTIVTASTWESPWFDPVRIGINRRGGAFSNCEANRWDATRLSTFVRLLAPSAVIGLTRELVEGLADVESGIDRLKTVPEVFVRPEAVPAVKRIGLVPRVFARLGPAIAVSAADGPGLAVNPTEWIVEEQAGELLVSSAGPRHTQFVRQRTGVAGRVHVVDGMHRVAVE